MEATHRGPFGGMIVIAVDAGTEITDRDGQVAVVDDTHFVVSRKGAVYVTPQHYERLRALTGGDGRD